MDFKIRKFIKSLKKNVFGFLSFEVKVILFFAVGACFLGVISAAYLSRDSETVDMRNFVPRDTLIFFETKKLMETLQPLVKSEVIKENPISTLDISVFDGMQIGFAVTGFEIGEKEITSSRLVLNLRPQFVMIAETHAWSWQISSLVENSIDTFVGSIYGENTKFEKTNKNGAVWYTWEVPDGRASFAVISGTHLFFGNNKETIDRCLSAKRGQIESLRGNENLSLEKEKAKDSLAFGFISSEGVKEIAGLINFSISLKKIENEKTFDYIYRILPKILNYGIEEIIWNMRKRQHKIEDKINIKIENDISDLLSKNLVSADFKETDIYDFLPDGLFSVTRYSLKNPRLAYRSLIIAIAKSIDPSEKKIIEFLSDSLLMPYGISNAENFLSAVDSDILTVRFDKDGKETLAIVRVKDVNRAKRSITKEIDLEIPPQIQSNSEIWSSEDDALSVAISKDIMILGKTESVRKSLLANSKRIKAQIKLKTKSSASDLVPHLISRNAVSLTLTKDMENLQKVAKATGKTKKNIKDKITYSLIETRFNKFSIERTYTSNSGFISLLLEQIDWE